MPRTRAIEVPQRPSPTGLPHLRISSSDRDKVHRRPLTEISPRLLGLRTPRGTQSGLVNPKKLGTRITDLETQLVQAQHELKSLKHHLSTTEVVKKGVKKAASLEMPLSVMKIRDGNSRDDAGTKVAEEIQTETDVFEVP